MSEEQPKNPLHGITLEQIVKSLFEHYGWDELGRLININCFKSNPSVKSSLKFLRKTPWARQKVEDLYISTQPKATKKSKSAGPDSSGETKTYTGMNKWKG